jgi:DNA-binding response OmpR family regulator
MYMEKKKILIVEDEPSLKEALETKLTHDGYSIITAKNGEEGLAKALHDKPDLMLLDIIMPHMGGMEMLAELRKDAWGKDAHVIVLTNISESEKISEATVYGAYDYLIKSDWSLEDLLKKIHAHFAK